MVSWRRGGLAESSMAGRNQRIAENITKKVIWRNETEGENRRKSRNNGSEEEEEETLQEAGRR